MIDKVTPTGWFLFKFALIIGTDFTCASIIQSRILNGWPKRKGPKLSKVEPHDFAASFTNGIIVFIPLVG